MRVENRMRGTAHAPRYDCQTACGTFVELVAQLNQCHPKRAAIVPMDGFHFDDAVLAARGDLPRKGAPHTFDVDGLAHLLGRLQANHASEVAIPLFDRHLEVARAGAALIAQDVELLLVEGNYLLLDQAPWDQLAAFFDLSERISFPSNLINFLALGSESDY